MALTLFTDGSLSVADKPPSGSSAAYQRQSAQLFETGSSKCSSNRDDRSRSRSPVRSNKMYTIEVQIGPTSSRSSGKGVGQSKDVAPAPSESHRNPDEALTDNEWELFEQS